VKNLIVFFGAVLSCGVAACSSSSSGSGAISCPAVGTKECPNSTAITQSLVDACNKCLTTYQAYGQCAEAQGEPATASCDSSGNPVEVSQDIQTKVQQNCASQQKAFSDCLQGSTSTGDGGS
jgi:hypothetical protein